MGVIRVADTVCGRERILIIDDTPSLWRSSSPYVVADGSSQHFSFQRWSPHSAGFGLCVVASKGKARARSTAGRHDGIGDGRQSASLRIGAVAAIVAVRHGDYGTRIHRRIGERRVVQRDIVIDVTNARRGTGIHREIGFFFCVRKDVAV